MYDQCMKKPEAVSTPKVLWMLVDFGGRVENLLKELWLLLQHDGRGQEAGPSERRSEPCPEAARPEPTSFPASTPGALATGGPSASTPRLEAIQHQLEPTATPAIPNPTHSGLFEYRRHSISASVGHRRPPELGDTSYR